MTRSLQPDVILMDIKMPKLDGLQAARQIQENSPTPLVIVTTYDFQELVKEASKLGAGDFLIKPHHGKIITVWLTATTLEDDRGEPIKYATTERNIDWLPET